MICLTRSAASKVKLPDIGVTVDGLKKGLGDVTNAAGKALKDAVDILQDTGKGIFDSLKKVLPGDEKK